MANPGVNGESYRGANWKRLGQPRPRRASAQRREQRFGAVVQPKRQLLPFRKPSVGETAGGSATASPLGLPMDSTGTTHHAGGVPSSPSSAERDGLAESVGGGRLAVGGRERGAAKNVRHLRRPHSVGRQSVQYMYGASSVLAAEYTQPYHGDGLHYCGLCAMGCVGWLLASVVVSVAD